MNKPIITTRETNNTLKVSVSISMVISVFLIIAVFSIINGRVNSYPSIYRDRILEKAMVPTILLFILWILILIFNCVQYISCYSYVDVYEDRMEGKGIQNMYQLVAFDLDYTKITSVTCSGYSVYVNTSGGKYKIVTNTKTAKEIFDYFNKEHYK